MMTVWNSWFHRPSVPFRISFGNQVTWTYITWLPQPVNINPVTSMSSSHVLEASIKIQKEIRFCKQTGLYILHAKWGLVVRDTLRPFVCFFLTSKTNVMCFFFKQHLFVYILRSILRTLPYRCRCSCKHFTIEEWLKISPKTSMAAWYRSIKPIWRLKFRI